MSMFSVMKRTCFTCSHLPRLATTLFLTGTVRTLVLDLWMEWLPKVHVQAASIYELQAWASCWREQAPACARYRHVHATDICKLQTC